MIDRGEVQDEEYCKRAIAYLKVSLPSADADIELSASDSPILTDLNNGLVVTYLVDQGDRFGYVQQRHLVGSKISETDVHRFAVANLQAVWEEVGRADLYSNVFAVFCDGNFEASLVLVDELWDDLFAHLAPNGFVIAIPNRDILAFCDAKSELGVAELRQLINRVGGGDHPLTRSLYRRDRFDPALRLYAI